MSRIARPREAAEIAARVSRGEAKRKIARETGLSPDTILRIHTGVNRRVGGFVRCGGCGGKIRRGRSCKKCQAEALRQQTLALKRRAA